MNDAGFRHAFEALTGHAPFPWQKRLHKRFVRGEFPACSLPTGLGKTSVMAVWLLALAASTDDAALRGSVPRRLAYVVNRRTIVDQATREAEKFAALLTESDDKKRIEVLRTLRPATDEPKFAEQSRQLGELRKALLKLAGWDGAGAGGKKNDKGTAGADVLAPLAISTLRGEFADNGEWAADPARPAIIVGTVDMIGSRLLFSGYGVGRNRKPMHAGFLGQDTLLVHDEAHLEPAFQRLIETITAEQERHKKFGRLRVMPLTATPRAPDEKPFELDKEDREHAVIKRRLEAKKTIELHCIDDEKKTGEEVAALAVKRAEASPGAAILVFVRKVEDVKKAVDAIGKAKGIDRDTQIVQLTGTLRGLERDALVQMPVFQRFLPESNRDKGITLPEETVFLVCTSAGEVGVDISADHLVCDLTTFDSMAQRFGRVNRYGAPPNNAAIDVVHPKLDDFKKDDPYDDRRKRTLSLLKELDGNASPKALGKLPMEDRIAAFSPDPKFLDATDILFDAWELTTIRERMPGRPPVADWLHGVPTEWAPPETAVAWRSEVQWISRELLKEYKPDSLLDVYPIKPQELLRDRAYRVFEELQAIAARHPQSSVWIDNGFGVRTALLSEVAPASPSTQEKKRLIEDIADATVLLSPFVGGLNRGMLAGDEPFKDGTEYDVADKWVDEDGNTRRMRLWDENQPPTKMRPVRSVIDLEPGAAESDAEPTDDEQDGVDQRTDSQPGVIPKRPGRLWKWYALPRSADDDGSRVSAGREILLKDHCGDVCRHVERIVTALGIANTPEGRALVFAAEAHDLGKDRGPWQRSIWNNKYSEGVVWAKSGHRRPPRELSTYRHEFGSVLDVLSLPENHRILKAMWDSLTEVERDLTLHVIAAHHGRARPHFPKDEAFDQAAGRSSLAAKVAGEVPRRFGRLQRKYGRWGLAYLESILRAADATASAAPSERVEDEGIAAAATVGAGGVQ